MEWLISSREPEALYAPVLDETALRAGAVKELLKLLPWYKRTPHMEVLLASALSDILRSGFERSFILKQMEGLDIAAEPAETFLRALVEQGHGRFGQPRYYYNQVIQAAPYQNGVVVKCQYTKGNLFTSATLFKCLELLDELMPVKAYMLSLTEYLKEPAYAEKAAEGLARQGLLLSCDSPRPAAGDYGPAHWTLDLVRDGELLSAGEWDSRLAFLEDSFDEFFFQSRNFFAVRPVRLSGDLGTVLSKATPAYFRDLSFKLQSFDKQVSVDLSLSSPPPPGGWGDLPLESSQTFEWSLTLDLRRDGERTAREVIALAEGGRLPGLQSITVILGGEPPDALARLSGMARVRFYSTDCLGLAATPAAPAGLRSPLRRCLTPHLRQEGCGAALSPYIDGRGDVYTCSLEGGTRLGNITAGAKHIEQQRRELRAKHSGACRFGVAPGGGAGRDVVRRFVREHPELGVSDVSGLIVNCP